MQISRERFAFHVSNLLTEQEARAYVDSFAKIYEAEKAELGVDLPDSLPCIGVTLVQGRGYSWNGPELTVGISEDLDTFVLESATALGRQWDLPGSMPGGFREGWPTYCSLLAGLRFAKDAGNSRMLKERTDFQRLDSLARSDPSLTRIDTLRTDKDGVYKAIYMLMTLHRRFGHEFWSRFLPVYRSYVADHPGDCPMPKFVELLSQAAGQDLKRWFARCGTTL
jgi:hypothetical protein